MEKKISAESDKNMLTIAKEDLAAALQAINQVTVKGVENCRMVLYADQLLRTAKPLEEDTKKDNEVR